jgi:hypothetical protein
MFICIQNIIEIPDHETLCASWNPKALISGCYQLYSRDQKVGWEDGLGSPGTITHYYCKAFNRGLGDKNGIGIFKCEECKNLMEKYKREPVPICCKCQKPMKPFTPHLWLCKLCNKS